MASKGVYYDPAKVNEMVDREIERRNEKGIKSPPVINELSKELLYEAGKTNKSKKNTINKNVEKVMDPLSTFKAQEAIQKKVEINNDESVRDSLNETNILLSKLPKYETYKTQIYPMSSAEIREKAVVNIISPNKEPGINNGLFDKRMGSTRKMEICVTCGRDDMGCGGHNGYIHLPKPIVNPTLQKATIWALQCICPYCSDTYIDEKFFKALKLHKVPEKKLLQVVAELSEKWLWRLHDHNIAKIVYDKEFKDHRLCFTIDVDNNPKKYIRSIDNIIKIFNLVPPEKLKFISFKGATHPLNFIQTDITCCPPCLRPPSIVNGKIVDHPLTERYVNVLSSIIKLQNHVGTEIERINKFDDLYAHIKSIAYGPEKKIGIKVPLKESGILPGLGSKKGIFRNNVQGKRVDYSARTPAGPGFELNMGEVMIPGDSAKKILLVPVIVHKYNLKKVIERFRKKVYRFMVMDLISTTAKVPISERHIKEYTPQIGDILLRPLEDGDRGLTGRQPSLHAESKMAYNFVLGNWDTIKIHSSNNACFNADFDGDELTYDILQDVIAMAEAETVMNFKYHIINGQSNRPMMALAFHGLMGGYIGSKSWLIGGIEKELTITERRWIEAISLVNDSYRKESLEARLARHAVPHRSGRALLSVSLPTNFTYSGAGLVIIDGVFVKGVLKKSNIGLKLMSLVQVLAKMYSIKEACRFINDFQKLADWIVMWHGLSIGYKDFNANRTEVIKMLKKELNKMQVEFFNLGPKPKDEILLFFWMRSLHGIVDKTKINGLKIGQQYLTINNSLNILSEDQGCGAKGSATNNAQIIGSLGMQYIGSNVPSPELKDKTRCLPYYPSNDISLESIGYVVHSYMDGINPAESFFHEMASRITLIDTAKNVSDVGYSHRRVTKATEGIIINWLGIITSSDGRMFQPIFGAGWAVNKLLNLKTSRTGDKLFFCDPVAEAKLLCRIYEKKVLGDPEEKIKISKPENEFQKFKRINGRFPKFSEIAI